MLHRVLFVSVLSMSVLAFTACGPAEPPAEEEAPTPPPPPPPTIYDLGEVDVVMEEPEFTSRNISVAGVKIGDVTNDMLEVLGDQVGDTVNSVDNDHYVMAYQDGGLYIYSFKLTGDIRQIEILTPMASEIASPQLRAWLEDGDVDLMRELMGDRTGSIVEVPETESTEYAYDLQGIRFVVYPDERYGIRFSYFP